MDKSSATKEDQFLWVKLKYLGSTVASFMWLSLIIELTGKKHWRETWWYRGLWLSAVGLTLLVFTNDVHQLFWEPIEIKPWESHSGRAKGPGFKLYVFWTTLLALLSIALILLHSLTAVSFFRRRNVWLLLSYLSPYGGYWLELNKAIPLIADIDPVPLMLVPSSIFMAVAMFRYQAMDIVPLAQKMVFENVHSAVVVIDPAKQVVATNSYARTIWADDEQGKADISCTINELDRQGLDHGAEIELHMNSNQRWYLIIVSELTNSREGNLGYSLVFVDITDRKQKEIEKTDMMDARARFFASVSHELRSPLHAIRGLLDITIDSTLTDTQRRHLDDAKVSANILLALINNVLDESRLDADMMPLEETPVDLNALMNQLQAVHRHSAEKKGLELRFSVDRVGDFVLGDPLRLTQVMTNLISNAIKFSDAGSIEVKMSVLRNTGKRIELAFTVTDTGIGISAEDISSLFKPFQQGELSTARRFGGTGLGLTISQALVSRMGGKITAKSTLNRGSTFHFVLEFEISGLAATQRADSIPLLDLAEYEILIVDDSEVNLEILAAQLKPTGIRWDSTYNGELAVEKAGKYHYDMVLMDVHMPTMDGLEAVGLIKQLPGYQDIPVVAMSASVLPKDRQLARNAYFDDFLDKPFTFDDLVGVLQHNLLPSRVPPNLVMAPPEIGVKVVDSTKGIASLNGNKDRFLELVSELTIESETQLGTLRACSDRAEQHDILHQLIGAAKLLRADRLANVASQIDTGLASNATETEVNQLLDQLQKQIVMLRQWITTQR